MNYDADTDEPKVLTKIHAYEPYRCNVHPEDGQSCLELIYRCAICGHEVVEYESYKFIKRSDETDLLEYAQSLGFKYIPF